MISIVKYPYSLRPDRNCAGIVNDLFSNPATVTAPSSGYHLDLDFQLLRPMGSRLDLPLPDPAEQRILSEVEELTGNADKALTWYRHRPIVGFGGQTAQQLVKAGHADAVLAHLEDLRDGNYA